ncbi:HGG containing motif thioesterase superfamily (plasmid) [Deinococcus geothermalis DSM 11300]|uniref:Medium/long-chain acyl-CoA thioesterase YigI n=1 Tax=Deinococcus geothermalis (strain DSM 11300 / CIP 105573 / AG-3a) TaxID=319795 RepID=Q1J3U9_DEIGD|nr:MULTISPECIES: PaaI family thioesterase [Deinococcus]ABF43835.1 HGG containing motif thioesterase superfamily [Deinococcus geothermalis DSM 11300]MBI0446509.1 PaaI family thioesterase [Deinococcus sp. DB0503]
MTALEGPQAVAFAQSVLDAQPFSVLVGARVEQMAPDGVVVRVPFRRDLTQHHGFAHGGLQAALADIALTFMGAAALGPRVLTSEFKINFLRPGMGEALVARGSIISAGKRQAVTRCDIFAVQAGEEKLVATALGTIVTADVPPAGGTE